MMFRYLDEPHKKEIEAEVVKVDGKKVILNESIFVPETNDVFSDLGTIGDYDVTKVTIKAKKLVHTLDEKPDFKKGDKVNVKLDWNRRYNMMKLHTAMHLVYFTFKNMTYYEKLLKNQVDTDKAYIDYKIDEPIEAYIEELQEELDLMISKDYDVDFYQDKKVLSRYWVSIKDNKYPCKYPVVEKLSELKGLKVTCENLGDDKERINIFFTE